MSAYPTNTAAAVQQQQSQQQHQQQQRHQQRLNELLEAVKQEFDFALSEASLFKQVKEDYDLKYNQQTAEMQQIRQTVYELEMAHRKIKEAYEDEILRLKTELENRDRAAAAAAQQHQHQQHQAQQQQQQQQQQHQAHQQQQAQQQQQQAQIQNGAPYSGYQQPPRPAGSTLPPPIRQSPPKDSAQVPKIEPLKENGLTAANSSAVSPAAAAASTSTEQAASAPEPETSTALTIIDKSQYIVNPAQKALHVKEIPPFLQDLDINKASPEFTKQHQDYFVLYNPAFERLLEIDLIHSLDHSSVVCCVRFSKNGEFVATGCNKTTQVFNVKTGELVAKLIDDNSTNNLNGENSEKNGTTNGESTAASTEGGATSTSPGSSTAVSAPASSSNSSGDLYIRSVCFSPDGKLLATGAEDKLIRIWDLTTKRIIKILRGHEQDIYSLEFFPDGNRLVSGSGDRTVRIWDLRSSQCSLTLSIEDGVTTVAVSPDGQLIAAGSLDRTVRVWDSTTGFLVERLDSGNEHGNGHEDSVYSVVFSANGKQLVSGCLDRTVKLWNLEGKQDSSENTTAVSTGKKSSCEVTYVGHKDFVLSVCLTSKNEYIISGSKDRGVIFWDEISGNPLLMLQGHRNSVISVAVSSNSDATEGIFATGSGDCKARLWRWKKK